MCMCVEGARKQGIVFALDFKNFLDISMRVFYLCLKGVGLELGFGFLIFCIFLCIGSAGGRSFR